MRPRVTVIILNWNGKADTLECLASLQNDQYAEKHVLVVDNGSSDDSAQALREACPDYEVLETGENLGFTGGNNAGIRRALEMGADYVFLLNNDTVVEPDALTRLVEAAQALPEYGILTPVINYYDRPDEAWFAGSRMDLKRGVAVHDNSHVPARTDPPRDVPWTTGCAMLIPAPVIQDVGGFDERYFLNWEDVDLSLRIRATGKTIALVPAARILHKVSATLSQTDTGTYYYLRNQLLLLREHAGDNYRTAARRVLLSSFRQRLSACRRGKGSLHSLWQWGEAVWHHYTRRYGCRDAVGREISRVLSVPPASEQDVRQP